MTVLSATEPEGRSFLSALLWLNISIGVWYLVTAMMTRYPRPLMAVLQGLSATVGIARRHSPVLCSKTVGFPMVSVAHRGGAAENAENTMKAFASAHHLAKCSVLELDVHLTKDGHVVVVHDANLLRVTGLAQKVSKLNLSELPPVINDRGPILAHLPKNLFDPKPSSTVASKAINPSPVEVEEEGQAVIDLDDYSASRIPTLEQVFTAFPNAPINLDIKVNSDELLRKVHELIVRHNRRHLIVWGSFDENMVAKCHALDPEIPTFCSLTQSLRLVFYYHIGLLPFVPIRDSAFEIPLFNLDFMKHLLGHFGYAFYPGASKLRNLVYGGFARFFIRGAMNRSFFSHLQQRGMKVLFWTVNTEAGFDLAFNHYGADGVITDHPTRLNRWLSHNPITRQSR